jgi:hypothetical protein
VIAPGLRPNLAQLLVVGDSKRVAGAVIPRPRRHRLRTILAQKVDCDARVVTDCYHTFRALSKYGACAPLAEFKPSFIIDRGRPDTINGFMRSFCHALVTQHFHVYERNAWKYLKEHEFRYNRRFRSERIFPDMTSRFPLLTETRINELKANNFVEL